MLVEQVSVGVACSLEQLGRSLDVAEQESDGATGRLCHRPRSCRGTVRSSMCEIDTGRLRRHFGLSEVTREQRDALKRKLLAQHPLG